MTKDTFLKLLPTLGFTKKGGVFSKTIVAATMAVDVTKEELIYPEDQGLKINERTTCNFSSDENFVVFECVHRLLEKGYKARHMELEPKWKTGHGASGGRADILIRDNAGKSVLITECKTAGREFEKAWKDTLQDGAQLFSYVMNADDFRDELRSKAVRSAGQYNINATKMRTMKIPIPPLAEQKRFVKTVEALEAEIAAAESIIAAAPAKKETVLKKYL